MEHTRDLAVQLLNEAKLCSDYGQKATLLGQLTELIARKEKSLIPEFLPELVVMQLDQSHQVRKWLASFISEACTASPVAGSLQLCASCLQSLVQDNQAGVAKQALFSCIHVMRVALALYALQPADAEAKATWEAARVLQSAACGVIARHANDGVRLGVAKLLESIVLMYTSPTAPTLQGAAAPGQAPRLPDAAALYQEADQQLRALLDLLRQAQQSGPSAGAPGPLLIVCLKSLAHIAVQRPNLIGKVLPPLLLLAKEGGFKATGSEDEGRLGTEVSVGNTLRHALSTILRSRVDTSVPWRDRLVEALQAIGAHDAAESSLKYIQRQDYKEAKASRQRDRPADSPTGKRPRLEGERHENGTVAGPALPASSAGPATAPAPAASAAFLGPAQPPDNADVVSKPEDVLKFLEVVPSVIAMNDSTVLNQLLDSLPHTLLADALLVCLANLPAAPPAHQLVPMQQQQPPPLHHPAGGMYPGHQPTTPPSGHMIDPFQRTPTPPPAYPLGQQPHQQQQGQHVGMPSRAPPPPQQPPGAPPQQQQQKQQQGPGGQQGEDGKSTALALQLPRVNADNVRRHLPPGQCARPPDAAATQRRSIAVAAGTRPPLLPLSLGPHQWQAMRDAAVRRIVSLGHLPQVQDLRELLLGKLAALCPQELGEQLLAHVVEAWQTGGRGSELALRWLYALFAQHCPQEQEAGGGPPSSSHAAGAQGDEKDMYDNKDEKQDSKQQVLRNHNLQAEEGPEGGPEHKGLVGVKRKDHEKDDGPSSLSGPDSQRGEAEPDRGVAGPGSSKRGRGTVDVGLSGTPYENVLLALLERLRESEMRSEVAALLLEAPALPLPGVAEFLQVLVASGGEWAVKALATARTLVLERPALRQDMLHLILTAALDGSVDTRSKAVRLVCNQLLHLPHLTDTIITFASNAMTLLTQPAAGAGTAGAADGTAEGQSTQDAGWTQEESLRYCDLYAALCIKQPALIAGLMATYAQAASSPVRAALSQASSALARALGPGSGALVALLRAPPAGAEPLLLHMLESVLDGSLPTSQLVEACRGWYAASGDVKVLAPLVSVLSKVEVMRLMPLLLQMPGTNLKALYKKLAAPQTLSGQQVDPMFGAAELLVALHNIDPARDGVPLRAVMAAVDTALHSPETFPQQVIAQAIQQMEASVPLPPLFMRTVISALKIAPKLKPFGAELLSRLISKQVWLDKAQWRGFLMLIENSQRTFFPVLLQLPAPVLERCVLGAGGGGEPVLKRAVSLQLANWASSPENTMQVLLPVRKILDTVLAQHQQEQAAAAAAAQAKEQAAAAAAAAAAVAAAGPDIKAEPEEAVAAVDGSGSGTAEVKGEPAQQQQQQAGATSLGAAAPAAAVTDAGGAGGGDEEFQLDFDEDEE